MRQKRLRKNILVWIVYPKSSTTSLVMEKTPNKNDLGSWGDGCGIIA